jgi:hypothetical protein
MIVCLDAGAGRQRGGVDDGETMSNRTTRRGLLKGTVASGAAVACPALVRSTALGRDGRPAPSDRLGAGCIGVGAQGRADMGAFLGDRGVQVLAVCDADRRHRDVAKADVDKRYGNNDCAAYTDFRELVVRDDIDVVMIAAPEHWHALMSVWAMRNGKDVYCEKPLSLTVKEGRVMVEIARRYSRVFSCGSQRVRGDYGRLADYVASGAIGEIREIYAAASGPSRHCSLGGQSVPDWLDWDLWLGPAPWQPFHIGRFAGPGDANSVGQWRNWHDFSGGFMTDWGAHKYGGVMYAAQLEKTGPVEIVPPDGKGSPLTYRFANGIVMYGSGPFGFVGTRGKAPPMDKPMPARSPLRQYPPGINDPIRDLLHCVRTRGRPFQDVEYAHRVASVCHLGNIACWLKRPLKWDAAAEQFVGDEEARRLLDRPRRAPWRL